MIIIIILSLFVSHFGRLAAVHLGTIGQIVNSYMLTQWRPVRPTNMNVHSSYTNAKLVSNFNFS